MAQMAKNPNVTDSLSTIWPQITDFIARANPNSATITKDNLPDKVKQWFRSNESVVRCDSIERLRQHGQVTLNNIDDRIRHDLHIERSALISEAVDAISEKKGVLIVGRAGIGKSALAKNVLERLQKDTPCFVFKAEEFNQSHVDVVLSNVSISDTIPQLSARFALLPRKVLLIESLERIFESNSVETIIQFLTTIAEDDTWIERSALISEAVDAISEKKGVLIVGRAGIGKSALAKNVLERLQKDTPCFVFKAEEFNQSHVDVVLSNVSISDTIPQLSARFALLPRKVLLIESLERIFESNSVETIIQFLTTIAENCCYL